MKTTFSHLQLNAAAANLSFYRDLFGFLGWTTLYEDDSMAGFGTDRGDSIWVLTGATKDVANDYDGPGLNHIGIGAPSQAEVDATTEYLRARGIETLFETPRHRPDFAASEDTTYYQVMFESPDRILFEVVYTGPKS